MYKHLIIILLSLICFQLQATHNRAGEITYVQLDALTIEATITSYTKASSSAADRDSLEIFWGDGTSSILLREVEGGEPLPGFDIKVNTYTGLHSYPGQGNYTMYFVDPNRVGNILNLNEPNSIDIPFYVETSFTLLNGQFQGLNNSVQLLQPPIDFACVNQVFVHTPNAFDPDGDSIAYELITPRQDIDVNVPDYFLPDQILPGPENILDFNELTGELRWDSPQIAGEYNISILIKEYREGVLINEMVRDMQILVAICNNRPPEIEVLDEYCVIAGELLTIPFRAIDIDTGQQLIITASGGPFQDTINPASISIQPEFLDPPVNGVITWQTNCNDVRENTYQIVIRAADNGFGSGLGLADLKTIQVKVVAPPPTEVEAEVNNQNVEISWGKPYICEDAEDDYFLGFSVWRRVGTNPFVIDTCEQGLKNKGYERIEVLTLDSLDGRYHFVDETPERGFIYCYRILAMFSLRTPSGNPFNIVESLASEEVCVQLIRDLPLPIEVSVLETDKSNGEISVTWLKPLAGDVDTLSNPGPYNYILEHSTGLDFNPVPGANFSITNFNDEVDTNFIHQGINTVDGSHFYQIRFLSNGLELGVSPYAESPFLNFIPEDEQVTLTWDIDVPWKNVLYRIFRQQGNDFVYVGESMTNSFSDTPLINGREYCYVMESEGTFGVEGIRDSLLNNSQIICGAPIDTMPPCEPTIIVQNNCEGSNLLEENEDFYNNLSWNDPALTCEGSADVAGYNIYYANQSDGTFTLLSNIEEPNILQYQHEPLIGSLACYAIESIDSTGNNSGYTQIQCIENCPVYELPNTFTPNGDNANDVFVPRRNRFIDVVDFTLFNQWGNLVFETDNPEINWDGFDLNGKSVDEGTYFYRCIIFDQPSQNDFQQRAVLSGYIEVIR